MQWKAGEKKKFLPRGWMIGKRKDRGEGGARKIFFSFPALYPHHLL